MTVIAYDGRHIACDTGINFGQTIRNTLKHHISEDGNKLFFCAGDAKYIMPMTEWAEKSMNPDDFPKIAEGDHFTLVVVSKSQEDVEGEVPYMVLFYENSPYPTIMTDRQQAWGCGMDYALGAMLAGACAERAVYITNSLNAYCGGGIIGIDLEDWASDKESTPRLTIDTSREYAKNQAIALPRFECHKVVNAGAIRDIKVVQNEARIVMDNSLSLPVSPEFMKKHEPKIGNYLVIYKDGYVSVSPEEAFNDGYSIVDPERTDGEDNEEE